MQKYFTCPSCGEDKPTIQFNYFGAKRKGACRDCLNKAKALGIRKTYSASLAESKRFNSYVWDPELGRITARICPGCGCDKPAHQFPEQSQATKLPVGKCRDCRKTRRQKAQEKARNTAGLRFCHLCGANHPTSDFEIEGRESGICKPCFDRKMASRPSTPLYRYESAGDCPGCGHDLVAIDLDTWRTKTKVILRRDDLPIIHGRVLNTTGTHVQFKESLGERGGTQRYMVRQLHRALLGLSSQLSRQNQTRTRTWVDHIDGNGFNNCRCNLRLVTPSQNAANSCKQKGDTSSQYKGVFWSTTYERWIARIRVNGKSIHLGTFRAAKPAARAYDKAALEHWGEYARLNLPEEAA